MTMIIDGSTGLEFPDGSDQTSAFTGNAAAITTGVLAQTNGGTGTTIGYNGFKNRIINGAMMIDQRNAGSATTGATNSPYTLDRWKVYSGGANCTVQRVAGFNGFQNALRVTGVASNNGISVFQRIESFNAYDLASQSITVSFITNSSVASRSVDLVFQNPTTTADDFGTQTEFARRTITVPNGIASHSVTVTASAGVIRGIQFVIELGALTSGTIDITGVQLEKGSTATSFDYRPYGTELALCQRYYYKLFPQANSNNSFGSGFADSTTVAVIYTGFPVNMRTAPSAVEQTGTASNYSLRAQATTTINCSSVPVFGNANENNAVTTFTVASGLTTGGGVLGRTSSATGTSAYLAWSAEL